MEKNECLKKLGSVIGALPFYLFTLLPFLAACGGSEKDYDATGTFEAIEAVYQSQKPDMERQIAATRQQLAKAQQDEQRYRELVADGAAPSKMLDDATSQVKVLQKQLDAQISSLNTSTQALDKQTAAADVQKAQLQDMLRKCHIMTPTKGTVLEKYVERGEFVSVGKPLFKIADTESMHLQRVCRHHQLDIVSFGVYTQNYPY